MVSDNMDNISHCAVIRYLGIKGLTLKEIHEDLVVTLGDNVPSYSLVKKWDAEFKRGRASLEDDPHRRICQGKRLSFLGRSQQFSSEICDYG